MIREERERRVALGAQNAAILVEKQVAEAQRLAAQQEVERVLAEANRQYLTDLKIPKYLAAIAREEQLPQAQVLWYKGIFRYRAWERSGGGGGWDVGHDNPEPSPIDVKGVALVWNLSANQGRGEDFGIDRWGGGAVGGSKAIPPHWNFQELSVFGSRQKGVIIILKHPFNKLDERGLSNNVIIPPAMTATPLIKLHEAVGVNDPSQFIKQKLASTYLDKKGFSAFLNWPFEGDPPSVPPRL